MDLVLINNSDFFPVLTDGGSDCCRSVNYIIETCLLHCPNKRKHTRDKSTLIQFGNKLGIFSKNYVNVSNE